MRAEGWGLGGFKVEGFQGFDQEVAGGVCQELHERHTGEEAKGGQLASELQGGGVKGGGRVSIWVEGGAARSWVGGRQALGGPPQRVNASGRGPQEHGLDRSYRRKGLRARARPSPVPSGAAG